MVLLIVRFSLFLTITGIKQEFSGPIPTTALYESLGLQQRFINFSSENPPIPAKQCRQPLTELQELYARVDRQKKMADRSNRRRNCRQINLPADFVGQQQNQHQQEMMNATSLNRFVWRGGGVYW